MICPQYVATAMLGYEQGDDFSEYPGVISTEQLTDTVIAGLQEERFLILPHPQVKQYCERKSADYDRWITGMRRLRARIVKQLGSTRIERMHKLV